jgi:serine/threonine protein kinase
MSYCFSPLDVSLRLWAFEQIHQRAENASGLRDSVYCRSRVSASTLHSQFSPPTTNYRVSVIVPLIGCVSRLLIFVSLRMMNGDGSTEQTDIWSIGVIAFIMLSGSYPFLRGSHDLEDEERKSLLKDAKYRFGPEWEEREISTAAKDFVTQCFQKDPLDRWSAADALEFVQEVWIPHLVGLEKWNEQGQRLKKKSQRKEVSFSCDEQALTPTKASASSQQTKRETLTRSVGSKRSLMKMDSQMIKGMKKYGKCQYVLVDSFYQLVVLESSQTFPHQFCLDVFWTTL